MATKDKILLCACGLVILLASPFLYVAVISILPNVGVIGMGLTGFILLCIGCASLLVVSFTFSRMGLWDAKRRHAKNTVNILSADGIVVLLQQDGTFRHLSAELEQVRAARMIDTPGYNKERLQEWERNAEIKNVLSMHKEGHRLEAIAYTFDMPLSRVQDIVIEGG